MKGMLRYDAVSDVGSVRSNNEDTAYVAGKLLRDGKCGGESILTDGPVAFAVADGMGGYEGGEVASEIAARSFSSFLKKQDKDSLSGIISALKDWAKNANQLVLDTAMLRPELSEMGTTFVGLLFSGCKAWLINIGDSRCYRLRGGVLKQLSVDHSERERTGDPGKPSNLIYNFLGNDPGDFFSDINEYEPISGDCYILCSDGLSDLVAEEIIEEHAVSPEKLVELAKEAGGRDNITVIAVTLC